MTYRYISEQKGVGIWYKGMKKWTGKPTTKSVTTTVIQKVSDINIVDASRRVHTVQRDREVKEVKVPPLVAVINEWRAKVRNLLGT